MKGFALFLAQSFILFLAIKIISKGYSFKTTNIHQENKAINHTNDTFVPSYTYSYESKNVSCSTSGTHAWAVLHSIAASYANYPNKQEKEHFRMFFDGFIHLYPSKNGLIQEIINEKPLEHNSREELVYYVCEIHNLMNKRLNKDMFNCRNAFDIWGGDCGCNS